MQAQISYSRLNNIAIHVMIWSVLGLYFYRQLFFSDAAIPYQYWMKQTITLGLLIVTFYFNALVLVPRLLLKNHTALYFVVAIGIVLAIALINWWVNDVFPAYQSPEDVPRHLRLPRLKGGFHFKLGDLFTIIISGLVIGISTTITTIQKWQKEIQQRRELEKEKISSELSFLKTQINPHFYFNTLNNIYALTEVDPKMAGEAIHQLSKMMRYLLYDTQRNDTILSEEIAFVKNYISLMQLRLTDAVKINVDIPANLRDMAMAPMIFLPFIENAFKHGVSTTQVSYINISISQKDKVLELTVNNSIRKDNSVSLDTNSGIGLVNTRRRLDLLYPGKYKLDICQGDAEYTVHLVLNLS